MRGKEKRKERKKERGTCWWVVEEGGGGGRRVGSNVRLRWGVEAEQREREGMEGRVGGMKECPKGER